MSCYVASNYCLLEHTNIIYFFINAAKSFICTTLTKLVLLEKWLQKIYLDAIMTGDIIYSARLLYLHFGCWILFWIISRFVISELYKCNILLRGTCNLIYSLRHKFNNRMDKRDVLKFSHIAFYVQFHSFLLLL